MSAIRDSRITVIGGGAIGASVAYALAEAGYDDIQLVDAADPATATTAQAAGLVGQPRATVAAMAPKPASTAALTSNSWKSRWQGVAT